MVKFGAWLILLTMHFCLAQSGDALHLKSINDKKKEHDVSVPSSSSETVLVKTQKSHAELHESETKSEEQKKVIQTGNTKSSLEKLPIEYERTLERMDIDMESSVRTGFYILVTISVCALLFVGWKLYKLRLSRAERKYGVQGDRTTQELAPLPVSMEDPESDDEDHTIFDAHRQIRIF